MSGEVPRAPAFMRRVGLEWLYRLYKEPRRLKRQAKSLPAFALKAIFDRSFIQPLVKPNRVVLYAHYAPPHPSASSTRILSLARYLRGEGVRAVILSSQPGPAEYDGFEIIRASNRVRLLGRLLELRKCPILVSSPPGSPAAEVALIARALGYRVVVDIRDPYVSEAISTGDLKPGVRTNLKRLLEASLFRSAHALSFVSMQLRDRMQELVGNIERPAAIAPNGIDRSIFYKVAEDMRNATRRELGLAGEPTFVYAGILGGKNLEQTLNALTPAMLQGSKLLVIGVVDQHSLPILHRLQNLAAANQIQDHVIWKENLPLREVARLLNACDIGINPLPHARSYCLPVKTYEYMACGLYNLAFGAHDGALSQLLNNVSHGQLCSDWQLFSNIAVELCLNIEVVRSGAAERYEAARKFDRSISNATLQSLLCGIPLSK